MATETELKFAIDSQHAGRLKRALALEAQCRLSRRRLISTYFDTPDAAVGRRHMTLRVRKQGRRFLQTVKGKGLTLASRGEWEDAIRQPVPDLSAPDSGGQVKELIDGSELNPLFTTTVTRSTAMLHPLPYVVIEAAIDQGQICVADGTECEPVCELELELKGGEPAALYDAALRLLAVVPLRIEACSKSERGYRLAGCIAKEPPIARAPSVGFAADATVDAVLQEIGQLCLWHLVRNVPAALADAPEAIHQVRVAVRRLRSALAGLKPMLSPAHYEWVNGELKSLGAALGPSRNWDVFSEQLLSPVLKALPDQAELVELARRVEDERRRTYDEVRGILRSPATTAAILRLARWFEAREWRDQPLPEQSAQLLRPMKEVAAALIARRFRQARKRGKNFKSQSPAERHTFRLAVKKLRYTIELWRSLFDKDQIEAYVDSLKLLQEQLGHLNDVRTAKSILAQLPDAEQTPAVLYGGGIVLGWHDRGLADSEHELCRQVHRFRRTAPSW